jgi:hypothetical protein
MDVRHAVCYKYSDASLWYYFPKEKATMLAYRSLITPLTLCVLLSTGAAQTNIPPPAVPAVRLQRLTQKG